MADRASMSWEGFRFTFYDFPGQTIYHDALLVEPETNGNVLFVGDSFTPSGIDERWVQCLPYGQTVEAGAPAPLAVRVLNPSDKARTYRLRPHLPSGWVCTPKAATVSVPPRAERDVGFSMQPAASTRLGVHVVTLDVAMEEGDLRQGCEAIVEVVARSPARSGLTAIVQSARKAVEIVRSLPAGSRH